MSVSRATTSAATRRGVPAATSSATAAAGLVTLETPARPRPDHERDLALRRLREPLSQLGGRAPHDLLEPLRQLAADDDVALGIGDRRASAARRGNRCADSNATTGQAPSRQLRPERGPLACPPRQEADEAVPLRDEPADDERRLDRRRARQHRDDDARIERRPHEPRARIGDPRQAGVRDERDSLAGEQAAAAAPRRAPPRCARGRRAAAPRSRGARAVRACAACPRRGRRRLRAARASTRSVTSSRLPIGVAQTASGTGYAASSASNAISPAPISPASRAELGEREPHLVPPGSSASRKITDRAGPSSSSPAAIPKPPPITTTCGPKMLISEPIAVPRWSPDLLQSGMLLHDEILRGRARAEHALGEPVGGVAGAVRLDMAATRACALARLAVLDDHHVAELGPAAEELSVDDHAAADARCRASA